MVPSIASMILNLHLQIQFHVVRKYMVAASLLWLTLVPMATLASVAGTVGSNIWLAVWSGDALDPVLSPSDNMALRIGVYSACGIVSSKLSVASSDTV